MDKTYQEINKIVISAGEIMLKAKDLHLSAKTGNQNFVTQYDLEVEKYLITNLLALIPTADILAEETAFNDSLTAEYVFIIDPIDGTTNFIHHLNHSAISLALAYKKEIVYSIIYNPYTNEAFTAQKGQGAYLNGIKMEVSKRDFYDSLIAYGTTPYDLGFLEKTFATVVKCLHNCREARRNGAASLDLANLCCGRYDGFFEYLLQPWDFAAGILLVKEAKGIITDFSGNEVDVFKPSSIIASNIPVYDKLINLIVK